MRRNRLAGLLLALTFAGFVFYSLLHTEPVKVLRPQLQRNGAEAFLAGAVENTGSSEEAIDLDIKYYDSRGRQVAQDRLRIDHLGGGETRSFSAPARMLPDRASYSVYLNHGRNPYGN